jgi:alpha-N-arabinofuranosidase
MARAKLSIHLDEPIGLIRPELYGQFSEHLGGCVDEGIWVGCGSKIANVDGLRSDVIEALRNIRVPVMRWPGGCFADDYHWMDGIGPAEKRPRTVNLWWGQTVETNGFGTHEFLRFCELVGCKPYLAGNLGSGTVREMRDWVEYCNYPGDSTLARTRAQNGSPFPFNVRYWGVGNEQWGCGGNLCADEYAGEYRRYATYLRDLGGTELFLIACGPDTGSPQRQAFHADWTRRFLKKLGSFERIHGLAAHYYCGTAGTATEYSTDQWYELLARASRIGQIIRTHRAVMDEFDPRRRIGLLVDEWGTWHPPTPGRDPQRYWQQNTLRDALVAGITLNAFNNHADQLVMCNIAQTVNVLQAMCLTDGDRMIVTPTYHVFHLFQPHQGATALRTTIESPDVSFAVENERRTMPALTASASVKGDALTLSLTNAHATLPQEVDLELRGGGSMSEAQVHVLTHEDLAAHNTFEEPDVVRPRAQQVDVTHRVLRVPPASVFVVNLPLSPRS